MRNFYQILNDRHACNLDCDDIELILSMLGENAKRMIEIGLVQDELIKLGFEWYGNMQLSHNINDEVIVTFSLYWACVKDCSYQQTFQYESPTWQQDLLSAIKERIS